MTRDGNTRFIGFKALWLWPRQRRAGVRLHGKRERQCPHSTL